MSTTGHLFVADAPDASDVPYAVIVLGRGGTGAAAQQALQQLAQQLQPLLPAQCTVTVAFVDKAAPSLPEALQQCASAGTVAVLPVFAPDEPALQRWLHKQVMRWRAAQAQCRSRIVWAPPLLQAPALAQLLQAQLAQALQSEDVAQQVDEGWPQDPAAWSQVPAHQHHVLVCTGPRCTALGAVPVAQALGQAVQASRPLRAQVQLLSTSCQYPCTHGPLAIVYPEGVWYGRLDAATAGRVLQAHVQQRQVDADHWVHGPQSLS